MLIKIQQLLKQYKLLIRGILHVGAHECEEWADYKKVGLTVKNIIWLEALHEKVVMMKARGHRIYELVAHNKDDEPVIFNVTNNCQSSSILPLQDHLKEHPQIHVVEKRKLTTNRIDTFYDLQSIPKNFANFVNLDIQGNELSALKGMGDILNHVDYIYTEVNTKHLYENCCLLKDVDEFLETWGFKRIKISMTKHGWGDAFYIKE